MNRNRKSLEYFGFHLDSRHHQKLGGMNVKNVKKCEGNLEEIILYFYLKKDEKQFYIGFLYLKGFYMKDDSLFFFSIENRQRNVFSGIKSRFGIERFLDKKNYVLELLQRDT